MYCVSSLQASWRSTCCCIYLPEIPDCIVAVDDKVWPLMMVGGSSMTAIAEPVHPSHAKIAANGGAATRA
jgi:hypothetical protein